MSQSTTNKRAAAWGHIATNECFTVNDIAMAIAEPTEKGRGRGHCGDGRVVRSQNRKTKQQKMWNAMKMHKHFTRQDLQMTAEVTDSHAKSYLSALHKSGYVSFLLKVKAGQKSKGKLSRYSLLRNTGKLAPLVRKTGVWDQNEQVFYPFESTGGNEL